jgi:hypothetical protein
VLNQTPTDARTREGASCREHRARGHTRLRVPALDLADPELGVKSELAGTDQARVRQSWRLRTDLETRRGPEAERGVP